MSVLLMWLEVLGEDWDGRQEVDWLGTVTAQGAAQTEEGLEEGCLLENSCDWG